MGFPPETGGRVGDGLVGFCAGPAARPCRRKKKKEYREVAIQIARVGNNLNQVAKWVNTYKSAADTADAIRLLADMWGDLKKIKAMVKGE